MISLYAIIYLLCHAGLAMQNTGVGVRGVGYWVIYLFIYLLIVFIYLIHKKANASYAHKAPEKKHRMLPFISKVDLWYEKNAPLVYVIFKGA